MDAVRPIILIHGFGGTPEDFGRLPSELEKTGYTVISPVVPGQTDDISPYDKNIHTAEFYEDWLNGIIDETIVKYGIRPVLAGFSMGGTLSALCADSGRIERLVLTAPFFSLPLLNSFIRELSESFKEFISSVPKLSKGKINDKEGYDEYTPGSMKVDLNAFLELEKLADKAFRKAPSLDVKTLVLHSVNDRVASFSKMKEAFSDNPDVTIIEYESSNHILLYDHDRADVMNSIMQFLAD